ncbi:MAG: translation initiation factor IF-6 [Candidatus Diapherotrites archaeon]|nr:translation initiation factor IF-6 [Candidatus Diapherotrites archaeon]
MLIDKLTIKSSPFIGVFSAVTDSIALVPKDISKKELKKIETFDVEIIKATVADSSLFGVMLRGIGNKFVAPDLMSNEELDFFRSKGIEILTLGNKAYGNLIALNNSGGIASNIITKKEFDEIKNFFGLKKFLHQSFSCTDLVGSSLVVSEKGFIVNPNIDNKEFQILKRLFNVNGQPCTANYGDVFVANDILANSNAVFVGSYTTPKEIIRINDAFGGAEK